MVYALIENGIVANIIWLYSGNAADFPCAVPLGDIPAAVGDTYDGVHFYRDGVRVLSPGKGPAGSPGYGGSPGAAGGRWR